MTTRSSYPLLRSVRVTVAVAVLGSMEEIHYAGSEEAPCTLVIRVME